MTGRPHRSFDSFDSFESFEDLVAEGASVPTEGWDFSWFEGRATEARPSWGYAMSMAGRLGRASAVLDIQTGGGEVLDFALDQAPKRPLLAVATEGWPPNVAKATALLRPRGVPVVAVPENDPLPFAEAAFDLVVSRHPVRPHWDEIARVLQPGGTYFAQHVGPGSVFELVEHFLGPQPDEVGGGRHPEVERADAEAAGLDVVDLRAERLRMEFSRFPATDSRVHLQTRFFTSLSPAARLRATPRVSSDQGNSREQRVTARAVPRSGGGCAVPGPGVETVREVKRAFCGRGHPLGGYGASLRMSPKWWQICRTPPQGARFPAYGLHMGCVRAP